MGTKWCCSGFREPENKVYADPDAPRLTDVRQFVEESLTLEAGAEMDPVADTFRGVENLDGVFNWEGLDGSAEKKQPQNEWRHLKNGESYGKDHAARARLVLKDADPEWVNSSADGWLKQGEPQRKRFFSFFSKILPQKSASKNAVELIEFARDLGNDDCVLQAL